MSANVRTRGSGPVPATATTGNVLVTLRGLLSNPLPFAVTAVTTNAAISYIQSAYAVPQTAPTTVTVGYTGAQTTGDLNVVVVEWIVQYRIADPYAYLVGIIPSLVGIVMLAHCFALRSQE